MALGKQNEKGQGTRLLQDLIPVTNFNFPYLPIMPIIL